MRINSDFIDTIRQVHPIVKFIPKGNRIVPTGNGFLCSCPFHQDTSLSLYVNPNNGYYHCFQCGKSGDVINFVMDYYKVDYLSAVVKLAQIAHLPLPASLKQDSSAEWKYKRNRTLEMNRIALNFFMNQLYTPAGNYCLTYLTKERNLSKTTIQKYGMGFAPSNWDGLKNYMTSYGFTEQELEDASLVSRSAKTGNTFDFFVNRAVFPFIDLSGRIIGFGGRTLSKKDTRKYLNSKSTICYLKNNFLFSLNFATEYAKKKKLDTIILCEGNLDVISLNQAGFENAVASCGTSLTLDQAKLLSHYTDHISICYDNDDAGTNAAVKATEMFKHLGVKTSWIHFDDVKDPDEYINKYGANNFRKELIKQR